MLGRVKMGTEETGGLVRLAPKGWKVLFADFTFKFRLELSNFLFEHT